MTEVWNTCIEKKGFVVCTGACLECEKYRRGICKGKASIVNSHLTAISTFEGQQKAVLENDAECAILIDIGTTTLVFQLVETKEGKVVDTVTAVNRQRCFGADVLSRIQAANEGRSRELRDCIQRDIESALTELMHKNAKSAKQLQGIYIAGNTTMLHLLLGYDCSGLGVFPFVPASLCMEQTNLVSLLGIPKDSIWNLEVTIFPGISAFVGADIVSDLYALEFHKKEEIALLIDLGTNGELALGNCEKILVTSAAAAPAFEGGNVTWGSSAIEITADLLQAGIIDETGLFVEEFFESGYPVREIANGTEVVFTQKDIRQLQLAKAAIRAGTELLLKEYGITKEKIDKVYLAGGFGYHLDVAKAEKIGLLLPQLAEKTQVVGNCVLQGLAKFAAEGGNREELQRLTDKTQTLVAAKDPDFNKIYMENLSF